MNLPTFLTDKRGHLLWQGLLVVLVLTMAAGFFVHGHPHFGFDGWPGIRLSPVCCWWPWRGPFPAVSPPRRTTMNSARQPVPLRQRRQHGDR